MLVGLIGLSFTASVDGGSPTDHHLQFDYHSVKIYNVPVYNITSLSLDSHTLLVTLLDTNPTSDSFLFFDYAFVNSDPSSNPPVKSPSR